MNKVKKGSILLEAIGAIAIVLITLMLSCRICITMSKTIDKEKQTYRNKESLNAICNEIKYNITYEELLTALKDNCRLIKYEDNFLNMLMDKKLLDFSSVNLKGNRVKIELLDEDDCSLEIKVTIYYNNQVFEEEVEKGCWMDYV